MAGKIQLPHKCPNCGKVANTEAELKDKFGYRTMETSPGNKVIRNQSWCKECR